MALNMVTRVHTVISRTEASKLYDKGIHECERKWHLTPRGQEAITTPYWRYMTKEERAIFDLIQLGIDTTRSEVEKHAGVEPRETGRALIGLLELGLILPGAK